MIKTVINVAHKRLEDAATRCVLKPVDVSKCTCGWGSASGPARVALALQATALP